MTLMVSGGLPLILGGLTAPGSTAVTVASGEGAVTAEQGMAIVNGNTAEVENRASASQQLLSGMAAGNGGGNASIESGRYSLPQGISQEQFSNASKLLRDRVGDISNDIVVQGSRAKGTAKPTSDIDISIIKQGGAFDNPPFIPFEEVNNVRRFIL